MKKFTDIFDKNYLIKKLTTVLAALFALGVIFYISYHIAERFKKDLILINATYKTVVENIFADAYIFRDETVIYSSVNGGSVNPAVHSGEKVSSYSKVADIYNYTSPDIENRIAEIDKQIMLLEQSRSEDLSVVSTAGLDSEIYQNAEKIRLNSENGNFGDAIAYRTELLVSIKKRDILTGNVKNFSEQINILLQEKKELTAKLGVCLESVYAPVPGYYYSAVDGYEQLFSAKALESITYDDFMALVENQPESLSGGNDSYNNGYMSAGKIATDFRWYIACPMTKAEAALFKTRVNYSITFPYNNKSLNMRLYSVISEASGVNAVAVFECESLPYDFDYVRMQPVQICSTDYTGFEIPISAIRIVDGYEGVYVLDEVTVEFRRINIIYEYDGYFLCTGGVNSVPASAEDSEDGADSVVYPWIRQNDIIVSEGKDLYIGKVIG